MSTMERAASAPEPSSAPARTWPVRPRRRRAGDEVSPCLRGLSSAHDVERARVDAAVGADAHGPAAAAEHRVALGGHEQALGVER